MDTAMKADYTEGTMVKGYRTRRARLNLSSDFLYVFRIKVTDSEDSSHDLQSLQK